MPILLISLTVNTGVGEYLSSTCHAPSLPHPCPVILIPPPTRLFRLHTRRLNILTPFSIKRHYPHPTPYHKPPRENPGSHARLVQLDSQC